MRLPVRIARTAGISPGKLRDLAITLFLRRHGAGMVLGEYLDRFLPLVPLMERVGIPYVVQGHGADLSAALRERGMAQRYQVYGSARAILTRCEFHRRRLIAIGLPAERIHVNPGGVDIPPLGSERPTHAAKRFLAVGCMVPKNGPRYVLEAFRLAALRDPDITLDYLGAGEFLPAAQQFVSNFGLVQRVRLHGAASEGTKQRLLRECGVLVQHSMTDPKTGDEEGLPAAIQQAMAYGLAIISTRHSGIPEAVEDEVTGLLTDVGDSAAMASAMLRLAVDEGRSSKFGAAARAKAERLYSWDAERGRIFRAFAKFSPRHQPLRIGLRI
jgi:colanic acid/amylovoran biosynthesis glycosyltransferase